MTITKENIGSKSKPFKIEILLIVISLVYIALIIFLPAVNVFTEAFKNGIVPFFSNFSNQDFISAIRLTLIIAFVCVPVNTVFGLCAAWAIARHKFPGRAFIISLIDLPFSISPVVAGLMIMLILGRQGWLGGFLEGINLRIVFATPGIVIATLFITLPFVAREVIPVLEEMGPEQEEAARTLGANDWQIFWRVTLPNIRWGLLYGVILTNARAMGEFGAVSVVSGNIAGETQSLPLFVEQAYKQYQTQEAFSAAALLGLLALVTLVAKTIVEQKTQIKDVD